MVRDADGGERLAAVSTLIVSCVAGAAMRLDLAARDDGIYWADEIYRTIEMGHRVAFGYGMKPWEFVDGAASWVYPAMLGALLKLAATVGLSAPLEYLQVVRVVFVVLAVLTGLVTWSLARSMGATRLPAAASAAAFLLAAPLVYFGHRTLSETASMLPVAAGLALTLAPERTRRSLVVGSFLLGIATLFRPQNGLVAATVLVVWMIRRRRPEALTVLATLVGVGVLGGVVDLVTWGSLFHSTIEYIDFNLVQGRASQWGTEPPTYYVEWLLDSMGALFVLAAVFAVVGARRAPALAAAVAVFVVAHSAILHKESRFLLPIVAPLLALAGVGVAEVASWLAPERRQIVAWLASLLILATAAVSATDYRSLTWERAGGAAGFPRDGSAYDFNGGINRLLLEAHQRDDLCGLVLDGQPRFFSGGYTYLHREVPFLLPEEEQARRGAANYWITLDPAGGGDVVATDGPWVLVRRSARCATDVGVTDRL